MPTLMVTYRLSKDRRPETEIGFVCISLVRTHSSKCATFSKKLGLEFRDYSRVRNLKKSGLGVWV